MARREKKETTSHLREHGYLVVLVVLIAFLFAFAFLSPVGLGGDITGFQVFQGEGANSQVAAASLFVLIFGVLFLVVFTFNLLSKVI